MTSALSPLSTASLRPHSTPLALSKPEGLAAPDTPQDAAMASASSKAEAAGRSGASRHEQHAQAGGGADGGGPRHVVDQRVTENETMRITVISYSDGSVDRLSAVKNGGGAAPAPAPAEPSGAGGWGNRGVMVDRVG